MKRFVEKGCNFEPRSVTSMWGKKLHIADTELFTICCFRTKETIWTAVLIYRSRNMQSIVFCQQMSALHGSRSHMSSEAPYGLQLSFTKYELFVRRNRLLTVSLTNNVVSVLLEWKRSDQGNLSETVFQRLFVVWSKRLVNQDLLCFSKKWWVMIFREEMLAVFLALLHHTSRCMNYFLNC